MNAPVGYHPFARFGAGPWHCIGFREAKYQACPGAPVQAAGTCDVCGTCIMYVYTFKCASGETFVTGCDCAQKAGADYGRQCRRAIREWRTSERYRLSSAEREAKAARIKAAEEKALADLRAAHPEWFVAAEALTGKPGFAGEIAKDFGARLNRGIGLTDKQAELLTKIYRETLRANGGHFGTVGVRVKKIAVTYEGRSSYESHFGQVRIYRFATADGCTLIWKTTSGYVCASAESYEQPAVGATLTMTATVKAHGEYQGTKQTELSRVKLEWP